MARPQRRGHSKAGAGRDEALKGKRASLFAFAVLGCAAMNAGAQSQRERGAALFQEKGCSHCHTIRESGGHKGPDLSGVGRQLKIPALRKQIVEGGLTMPAFGDSLTGEETNDLIEYLHHCRQKAAAAKAAAAKVPGSSPGPVVSEAQPER